MFKLARGLIRHKIGVVAVIAFAVVMFSGSEEEQAAPSSPWAKQAMAAQPASQPAADDDTITGKLGGYANAAGEYAAETFLGDKDLNPVKLGEDTVDRFGQANEAFAAANGNPTN
jgi:hypothetical protein